jgi:hypothetical protein
MQRAVVKSSPRSVQFTLISHLLHEGFTLHSTLRHGSPHTQGPRRTKDELADAVPEGPLLDELHALLHLRRVGILAVQRTPRVQSDELLVDVLHESEGVWPECEADEARGEGDAADGGVGGQVRSEQVQGGSQGAHRREVDLSKGRVSLRVDLLPVPPYRPFL